MEKRKKETFYGNTVCLFCGFLFFPWCFHLFCSGVTVLLILYGECMELMSVRFFILLYVPQKVGNVSNIPVLCMSCFLSRWCFLSPENKNEDLALYLLFMHFNHQVNFLSLLTDVPCSISRMGFLWYFAKPRLPISSSLVLRARKCWSPTKACRLTSLYLPD